MLAADFCREPFSLYSGAIFESIIIKFDSRLLFDRESFLLSDIQLSPFPDAFYQLCELFFALRFGRCVDIVGGSLTV